MSRIGGVVLALGLIALVGWPLLNLILHLAGEHGESLVSDPLVPARGLDLSIETIRLVGLTLLLVLPAGTALAYLLTRTDLPCRTRVVAILLGLFLPLPLQAIVWLGSFGNLGRSQALGTGPVLVGLFGAAFVHAVAALPWVVLITGRGWRLVEPALEELARMNVTPWRAWRVVTLHRAAPSIAAASVFVAAITAGEMTVADLIPIRTYAEEAYTIAQQGLEPARLALHAAAPQVVLALPLVLVLGMWLTRASSERLATSQDRHRDWSLGPWRWGIDVSVWVACLVLIGLPVYGVAWRAGRAGSIEYGLTWSVENLTGSLQRAWVDLVDPELPWFRAPLWGTVAWSAAAATIAVAMAWGLAWYGRSSLIARFASAVVFAVLLATPAPMIGMIMKLGYVHVSWMNRTPALMVIALAARTLPFALLALWPAVRAVPGAWVEAAALEGLGPVGQAWRVGVGSTRADAAIAWLLAFALALGEMPAAYFTRAPGYEPLAGLVWSLLHVGVESRLAAIGLILFGATAVIGLFAAGAVLARDRESGKLDAFEEATR